jgi:hypothetical protein
MAVITLTIVGLQWQTGMLGFEASKHRRDRKARDVRLSQALLTLSVCQSIGVQDLNAV